MAFVPADMSTVGLQTVTFGTFLPLFGLIVGTGVIGPEIDDGSAVHLLGKPLSRHTVVQSKLAVAVLAIVGFAVVPMVLAAVIPRAHRPRDQRQPTWWRGQSVDPRVPANRPTQTGCSGGVLRRR